MLRIKMLQIKMCKITKFIFFAFICLVISGSEELYYEQYQKEIYYNKTTLMFNHINNNKTENNTTNRYYVSLIIGNIIVYPFNYFIEFFIAGIYY